ncbi:MAG TPA: hypothetical protein VK172_10550 [Lentimicrobium sp.]|nr:hypothetical protein [Lentimicrobium sp.]
MILTHKDAQTVKGTFYEYQYETIIKRTEISEKFGCFKNNNKQEIRLIQRVFCWSDKAFNTAFEEWQRSAKILNGTYTYRAIGKVSPRPMRAEQVVELYHRRTNYKVMPSLIEYDGYEIIM